MSRARARRSPAGPRRAAELDDRHEMRRIDRMRDEAARAAGEVFGEARGDDRRGRGREDRVGAARAGRARRRCARLTSTPPARSPARSRRRPTASASEARDAIRATPRRRDRRRGRGRRARRAPRGSRRGAASSASALGSVSRTVPAGAREHDGPGAADQAGADDRNTLAFRTLPSQLTATAPCGAARDRRAAPATGRCGSRRRARARRCGRTARAPGRGGGRR